MWLSAEYTQRVEAHLKRALVGTSIWFFLNAVGWASLVVRMPEIKDRLQVSNGELGVGLFIAAVGAITALRPAGRFCAKYGSAPVMRSSAIAAALLLPTIPLPTNLWVFGLCGFLYMFTIATMDMAMNAQAVAIEHASNRLVMGRLHGLWSVGGIVGGLLGGIMASIPMPLAEQAVLMAVMVAVIATGSGRLLLPAAVDRRVSADGGQHHRHPLIFWLLGLVTLCATVGEGSAIDWGAVLLRDEWGASASVASVPYIVFQTAMVIGRFSSDALSQRIGRANVLLGSGLLVTIGLSLGLLLGGVPGIAAGWFLLGLGVSVVFPMMMSIAGAIAIRDFSERIAPSQAVSMVAGVGYAAFLVGPPIIGFLGDAISLRWAMLLPAVLGLGFFAGARVARRVD